jgi:hypothetical protein
VPAHQHLPHDKVKISNCGIAFVAKVLTLAAMGQPLAARVILGPLLYPLQSIENRFQGGSERRDDQHN